jgi:hypothetical protein
MNKTFSTPVYASNYIAGFGIATGCALHSIDYDSDTVRFSLIGGDGTSSIVNGLTVEDISEDTVAEAIRATVAATNP